jgi:hypothetical protein
LYQLFYEGEKPPELPDHLKRKASTEMIWGSVGKDARLLAKLRRILGCVDERERKLILFVAQDLAGRRVRDDPKPAEG